MGCQGAGGSFARFSEREKQVEKPMFSVVPAQQPVSGAEDGDEEGEDWVPMCEEGAQEMGG